MSLHWKTWTEQRLLERRQQQLWRERKVLSSPQGARIAVDGRELVNFCSNDYLGLANHPQLREAAIEAIQKWGCGSGASHLICGHTELHERLEHELAHFVGAERAVLFSTGYMANLAIPQTFLGRDDQILSDKLNHASLIDAVELMKPRLRGIRYPHLDVEAVAKYLTLRGGGRTMIVTDGVFSMDGDVAPLPQLVSLANEYQALLLVDDAHGFGVMGKRGSGTLEHFQIPVTGNVLMMGTLGKAAGSFGAFVAGDQYLIEAIVQFGRTYTYTTALPATVASMALSALSLFRDEPQRREQLRANIQLFRHLAEEGGLRLGESNTAIQPVFPSAHASDTTLTNQTERVIRISQQLLEAGFWVTPIRPPTVPMGTDRLRITLTADHHCDEIEQLVITLVRLMVPSPDSRPESTS